MRANNKKLTSPLGPTCRVFYTQKFLISDCSFSRKTNMTKRGEVYKCFICGNIVEILHAGSGGLVCCGEPMKLMIANADDKASKEKHVPIVKGKTVKVGSVAHPMEEAHYIEWISAESEDGEQARVYLIPSDKPEATFSFKVKRAYAYCNIHGLWKSAPI